MAMTLLRTARDTVREDARRAGMSPRIAWTVFWLPVVATVLVTATLLSRPLFVLVTREDSVLEWGQVACFLAAAVLAAVAAARLRGVVPAAVPLVAGFAVLAFFTAGEEISWGQRIFDWGTPASLSAVNHQDETTLHNITAVPVQKAFNIAQLVAGAYGGLLAVALRTRWRRRPVLVDLLLPALFLAPAFLLLFGYRFLRLTLLTEMRFVLVKYGELPELAFAFALAVFAFTILRQADALRAAPGAAAPVDVPEQAARQRRPGRVRRRVVG